MSQQDETQDELVEPVSERVARLEKWKKKQLAQLEAHQAKHPVSEPNEGDAP